MSTSDNIKKLRSIFGVTQDELGEIAGVTGNAVSQWENGRSEPRMGAIERMAACYRISKSNIIEDGGMDVIDPVTKKLRRNIPPPAIIPTIDEDAYLPIRGRVHAGDAQEPDAIEGKIIVSKTLANRHPSGYFLEVEGDCMDKVYPEGCHILIDPDKEPQNGSVAVVSIDGTDYVMRRMLRTANTMVLSPESYNSEHEDVIITADSGHTVELIGTVVWFQPSKEME